LPQTKPRALALARKTYVANQNNTYPKAAQEDIADGYISSTSEPYRAHRASRSKFHCAQTNSTISYLSQESNAVAPSNIFHTSVAFFHILSSCQAYLLFFELDQEIPRDPWTSPSRTFLYALDRKIQYKQS
jgi:hypothetical protein